MASSLSRMDWGMVLRNLPTREEATRLSSLDLPIGELRELAIAPEVGRPYGRNVIYEGEEGEVLLVQWSDGEFCALHDHGIGAGVIGFIEGDYDEEFWRRTACGMECEGRVTRAAGDWCYIGEQVVHRVRSRGGGISIHFYVPSSSGMRLFDVANRRTLYVEDDCGAWIDESKITEVRAWE